MKKYQVEISFVMVQDVECSVKEILQCYKFNRVHKLVSIRGGDMLKIITNKEN